MGLDELEGELGTIGAHEVHGVQDGDEHGGADQRRLGDEQLLHVGEHAVAGELLEYVRVALEVLHQASEERAHALDRALVARVRETLGERVQGALNVHELGAHHVLRTVGGDGERVALRRDREEVDVGETGGDAARLRGVEYLLGVAARQDLERRERLLGHVHALYDLELFEKDADAVGDDAARARQRVHHVGERTTRVVHELEVVAARGRGAAHALQEQRHGLLDGKADQGVLVAHDEQLAELDERRELERVVAVRLLLLLLQRVDELLGARRHVARHRAVQELLHLAAERVHDVRRKAARLQQIRQTAELGSTSRSGCCCCCCSSCGCCARTCSRGACGGGRRR